MAKAKYKYNERIQGWSTLVWDGTYTKAGEKHRKALVSKKSSADLEKQVAEFKAQLKNGGALNYSGMTFPQYAQKWFEISKATSEINTQRMYRTTIKYFDCLYDVRISDIRHSHLQMVINNNADHPKTCKNIETTFRQIIRSAVRDKLLPRNALEDICSDITLPKYVKPSKRPLDETEKEAFLKAELSPMKQAFVSMLYACGLRRGEALALTRFDFNWERNEVSINKVIVFDGNNPVLKPYPKSERGVRTIPIPAAMVPRIKPYVESCDGYLFHGRDSEMMTETSFRRMWASIITSMNIAAGYNPQAKKFKGEKPIKDLTCHIFRHNYCTELCYKVPQISTKKIAQLLGDTEKMVLDVYSHIVDSKENVVETINEALGM
ncbi:MAG: site-specific integrase [Butyrivibrio sp.]|nr:site-specific integrase [Butyrivibrio sp.]